MHRVATDANFNLAKALRELRRLGYKRIGLALPENLNRESGFLYQGRFLVARERYPETTCIPPLLYPEPEIVDVLPQFKRWVNRHRPDVIVCNDQRVRGILESWGHDIPGDLGLVHLSLGPDTPDWSGMFMDGRQIGAACVDLLISQIQHNQRGVPRDAYEMLLRSRWLKGKTTRSLLTG